jgi:serine phosphatase RsbU (regulator of sigma subunit)
MNRESDSLWSVTLRFAQGMRIQYKVTGGSWWTEALDSNETLYDNFRLHVERDTMVRVIVYDWLNRMADGRPILDAKRFRPERPYLGLDGLWKYHSGDDPEWAQLAFNDSLWVVTDPFIRWSSPSEPHWDGIGWFRFPMYVDSSLWNTTLAIRIEETGASQIYYNGKLLYSFGVIGDSSFEPKAMTWWQPIRIDPAYKQLIAVRYANYDWKRLIHMGLTPGFLIVMKDLQSAFQTATGVRENAARQMVFALIPLTLFFLHILLYGFFRKQRQNLYYALCMLGFAGLTFFNYERGVVIDVKLILLYAKLSSLSALSAVLFGLLTIYELNYRRLPRRFWGILGLFLVACVVVIRGESGTLTRSLIYLIFAFSVVEGILPSILKTSRQHQKAWLLFAGFTILNVFIVLQLLMDYSIIGPILGSTQVYVYGMMALAIMMSIFLSVNFAEVNRNLEIQLKTVQELSEKALEQERVAHRLELERRMMELENERKTKELESARELQLSLLPQEVPKVKGLDIAAFMSTATEVGGDYYDFFTGGDGTLTIALGDATGHGLKAGNMVTATKGLLNALTGKKELTDVLNSANRAIKGMNLRMLTMCLAIARVEGKQLSFTSAGMPPLITFRAGSGETEEHLLKAMPLGAVRDFPYATLSTVLSKGDIVAMFSDGLLERFDKNGEPYGIENIMTSLARHAQGSAQIVLEGLVEDANRWAENAPLTDDLTVVVFRVVE